MQTLVRLTVPAGLLVQDGIRCFSTSKQATREKQKFQCCHRCVGHISNPDCKKIVKNQFLWGYGTTGPESAVQIDVRSDKKKKRIGLCDPQNHGSDSISQSLVSKGGQRWPTRWLGVRKIFSWSMKILPGRLQGAEKNTGKRHFSLD